MKRISVMGLLSLVAVMAFSLIGVTSSFAADFTPERGKCKKSTETQKKFVYSEKTCQTLAAAGATSGFYWVPNTKTSSVTGSSGEATLRSTTPEGTELAAVKCTSSKIAGKIIGTSRSESVATFEGCSSAGESCHSGATAGVIVTNPLEGNLGFVKESTDEVGEDITAVGGSSKVNAKFECGINKIETRGSVIGNETPIDKKGKVSTIKFFQVGGKQSPENFEGAAKDTLMTEINGLGGGTFPFNSTQEETATITGPALELRA